MISEHAQRLFANLADAPRPLLIATDLDGTLAPIVDRPADAHVPYDVLRVLEKLAAQCRIAVVTGRDLNTARKMVPVDDVIIIGSHGLESSIDHELLPTIDRTRLAASIERVERKVLNAVPGIYKHTERKAISTAFHFRELAWAEERLEAALADLPPELALRRGKMVLEVLPSAEGGKDRAMMALIDRFRPRTVLTLGDDLTDVGMFRVVAAMREETGRDALIVGISGGTETPPEIETIADVMLPSAEAAHAGLLVLCDAMEAQVAAE